MNPDQHRSSAAILLCVAACVCGSILFVYRAGDRELWSSHEARAAQNAQTMLDTGDWLLPRRFDGQPELQKPPLYYWLVAAFAWLHGGIVNEWDARLPAITGATGTVLLLLFSIRARPIVAIAAAFFLATMQHFTWIGRTGRIDVPLTFAVTAAILGLRSNRAIQQLGGYVALAFAVLLKGPIGAVLVVAVSTADRVARARNEGCRKTWWWGVPLVLALTVPWFLAVHWRTDGEFTRIFFWYHHFQRATGGAEAIATHPWWTYLVRLAVDTLPWSPFLIAAIWCAIRTPWLREDSDARFGFVWLTIVVALLSLSRFKRADYLLPAYPGMAIALGCWFEQTGILQRWPVVWQQRGLTALLAGAAAIWFVLLHTVVARMDAERSKSSFAAYIRTFAPRPNEILLFRVEDHLLGFHLGRPLNSFLEWENLNIWAGRPGSHYVVMPAECADGWRQYISSGRLEELARCTDRTDRDRPRDLILVRTIPNDGSDALRPPAAASLSRGNQRAAAVLQSGGGAAGNR